MGEDEAGARVALRQLERVVAERRDAAAGVDQDRHAAVLGEAGEVLDRGLAHRELLGARVELDPVGAEVEAALRLGERAVVRVDPAEVDDAAVGAGLDRPRLVVGGRVAVRLVHREGDRAGAGVLHRREQLLGLLAEFVGIVAAEVGVGVEEGERPGLRFERVQPAPRLDLDRLDLELLRPRSPPVRLSHAPPPFAIRFTASSTRAGEVPMFSRAKPAPCGPKLGPGLRATRPRSSSASGKGRRRAPARAGRARSGSRRGAVCSRPRAVSPRAGRRAGRGCGRRRRSRRRARRRRRGRRRRWPARRSGRRGWRRREASRPAPRRARRR